MTRKELTQKLREITGRNDITIRLRAAKSKYGEHCGYFVALYGDYSFVVNHFNSPHTVTCHNENLWYSDEREDLIKVLTEAGLNVISAPGEKYEIFVEVFCYYKGATDKTRYFGFRTSFKKADFDYTYAYAPFKMVNI